MSFVLGSPLPVTTTAGVDLARSFNGSSDKITSPSCILYSNNGGWTYATWVNVAALPTAYSGLFVKDPAVTILAYIKKATVSTYNFALYYNGAGSIDPITGVQNINQWVHFAASIAAGTNQDVNTYINGVLASHIGGGNSTGADTSGAVTVGDDPPNTPRFLNGAVADEAFWNIGLTPIQIANLAAGRRANTIGANANLTLYWPILGQSPEPDKSGNANNGTLTGTTIVAGPPTLDLF